MLWSFNFFPEKEICCAIYGTLNRFWINWSRNIYEIRLFFLVWVIKQKQHEQYLWQMFYLGISAKSLYWFSEENRDDGRETTNSATTTELSYESSFSNNNYADTMPKAAWKTSCKYKRTMSLKQGVRAKRVN